MSGHDVGIVLTALLASGVEFVEALTIVLAMGTTRGWRSAWAGVGAAVAVLAALTVVGGYALQEAVPEHTLQLVIGALLLLFGLQWLRKAVLRAAGLKALHDEDATYREQVEAGRAAPRERRFGLDWVGFAVTFKGVLLEGVEVVIIVIGFGVSGSVALPRSACSGRDRDPRSARFTAALARARTHEVHVGLPLTSGRSGRRGLAATGPAATRCCRCCWRRPGRVGGGARSCGRVRTSAGPEASGTSTASCVCASRSTCDCSAGASRSPTMNRHSDTHGRPWKRSSHARS